MRSGVRRPTPCNPNSRQYSFRGADSHRGSRDYYECLSGASARYRQPGGSRGRPHPGGGDCNLHIRPVPLIRGDTPDALSAVSFSNLQGIPLSSEVSTVYRDLHNYTRVIPLGRKLYTPSARYWKARRVSRRSLPLSI